MKNFSGILFIIFCITTITSCKKTLSNDQIYIKTGKPILPVLAKKEHNKVLDIKVSSKNKTSSAISSFTFSLVGTTNINDIKKALVLYSESGSFEEAKVFGTQQNVQSEFYVNGNQPISVGDNQFWLSIELKDTPNLSHKIGTQLIGLELVDGSSVQNKNSDENRLQRIGVALKQKEDNGVNTFRIPGLATTNRGTLIGVYDVRYNDPVDLQEDIDVGLSRSTDGGQTWEPMKIIMDMGEYGGYPEDENGIGDAAVLVDSNTNTIWVAGLWFHGKPGQRAWNASAPGMRPEETGQLMLVKSKDDGLTWSEPINITVQTKKPEWQLFFNGPGAGITMKDGTLVFAAQFKDKDRIPYSTIIYSKDGGTTWQVGTGAKSETTEAQVVELADGSLMLNMRDDRNRVERQDSLNGRSVAITTDLGKTWSEHPSSRKALQASNCMASIISYENPENSKLLFFSNPNTKTDRNHITIKTSFDDGMTWPIENQLELYEENTYGYSCLTIIDKNHIGILYEGNRELYFEKISLDELIPKH